MKQISDISCAVLIAVKNGENYLEEQLLSIKSQSCVRATVFYSCDDCTDKSEDILTKYQGINLNTNGKVFGSAAKNFFFMIKTLNQIEMFDYIFLADQDDIWLPNKMINARRAILNEGAEAYSSSFYAWDEKNKKVTYKHKSPKQTELDYFFRSPGPGFTYCFTTNAFSKIQLNLVDKDLNKLRWHDWALYALARDIGIKWHIDEKAYALYRLHDNNDTGQITGLDDLIKRAKFLLGGHYTRQIQLIAKLTKQSLYQQRINRMHLSDRFLLLWQVRKMRFRTIERLALILFLILTRRK